MCKISKTLRNKTQILTMQKCEMLTKHLSFATFISVVQFQVYLVGRDKQVLQVCLDVPLGSATLW